MEVTVAVLADAANIAKGEKLNILGTFDRIAVPAFPWTHPFMVLALAFRLTYEDARATHELAVTIKDEDGHDVAKASTTAKIGDLPAGEFATVNQILAFAAVGFTKPGRLLFDVTWDRVLKASVPLVVTKAGGAGERGR